MKFAVIRSMANHLKLSIYKCLLYKNHAFYVNVELKQKVDEAVTEIVEIINKMVVF